MFQKFQFDPCFWFVFQPVVYWNVWLNGKYSWTSFMVLFKPILSWKYLVSFDIWALYCVLQYELECWCSFYVWQGQSLMWVIWGYIHRDCWEFFRVLVYSSETEERVLISNHKNNFLYNPCTLLSVALN